MLLELAGSLSIKSLLVVPHVILVTDRALVVLVIMAAMGDSQNNNIGSPNIYLSSSCLGCVM